MRDESLPKTDGANWRQVGDEAKARQDLNDDDANDDGYDRDDWHSSEYGEFYLEHGMDEQLQEIEAEGTARRRRRICRMCSLVRGSGWVNNPRWC